MTIRSEINFGYLAAPKIAEFLRKLYYFVEFTHLKMLALVERLKNKNTKTKDQKLADIKVSDHLSIAKAKKYKINRN